MGFWWQKWKGLSRLNEQLLQQDLNSQLDKWARCKKSKYEV